MKETEKESQNIVSSRNKLIWLLLISLGSITYLAGYYIVPAFQTRNKVLDQCPSDICAYLQYKSGEFDANTNPVIAMEINNLSPANQFIILEGFPLSESKVSSDITLQLEVSSFAVDKNQKIIQTFEKKEQVTSKYSVGEGQKDYSPQPLGELTDIKHDNYIFVVRINNMGQLQQSQVNNLRLAFITVNSAYINNLNYFKWFLFTVAIAAWFLFKNNLSKLPKGYTSLEQNKVNQLALLLLFFTQPFASYFAFSTGFPYKMFTVLLIATQGSILISLWFNLLERLAAGSNPVSSATKFSINFFSAIHLVVYAVLNGIFIKDQDVNPLLGFNNDISQGSTLCKYYSYVFVGIVSFWTLLRLLKVIGKIREFDWRDSSALLFSFYYILCYMFFMSTGSLQMVGGKGARVVLLFGITTLYTVLLQILYASFGHEVEDAEKRKKYDNPDARNQYDDLDMSDMSSSKKDDIKLRSNDQMKNKPEDDFHESEEVEV